MKRSQRKLTNIFAIVQILDFFNIIMTERHLSQVHESAERVHLLYLHVTEVKHFNICLPIIRYQQK